MVLLEPEVRLACCSLDRSGFGHAGGGIQIFEDVFVPKPK